LGHRGDGFAQEGIAQVAQVFCQALGLPPEVDSRLSGLFQPIRIDP